MAHVQSQEYKSLKASLASDLDSVAAARGFIKPTSEVFRPGYAEDDIEDALRRAWTALINVAAGTAHESQAPLIDIVRAVQKVDLLKEEAEWFNYGEFSIWGENVNLFGDMPLFGAFLREEWNKAPGTNPRDDFSPEQWCNLNAFLAHLTALSASVPAFDFSLYAIWAMRTATEGAENVASADIAAAKMWFLYAYDMLEELSNEEKTYDGKLARAGDRFKDKQWTGFNQERWSIWKAALHEI